MNIYRAFTLLELLIVITIISLLSSLLFPVLAKAIERTKLTQDISQMRQVYSAIALYEQDNDDHSAPSLLYTENYAGSTKVYVSPIDPFRNGIPGYSDFPANINGDLTLRSSYRISYAYLYPLAKWSGLDEAWYEEHRNDPSYGILSLFMYNDPFWRNYPSQIDIFRVLTVNHRILMDGSFKVVHEDYGIGAGCSSIEECFGTTPW